MVFSLKRLKGWNINLEGDEVVDNMTNDICICQIDIDAEGNVYIAPKGHNEGFTPGANWNDPIGICATTVSFLVDGSEPQEEEETEAGPLSQKDDKIRKSIYTKKVYSFN